MPVSVILDKGDEEDDLHLSLIHRHGYILFLCSINVVISISCRVWHFISDILKEMMEDSGHSIISYTLFHTHTKKIPSRV